MANLAFHREAYTAQIGSILSSIGSLPGEIGGLSDRMDTAEGDISAIEAILANFDSWPSWTPTFTPSAGTATPTTSYAKYIRVGVVCFYAVKSSVNYSNAHSYTRMTLPVDRNAAAVTDCSWGIGVKAEGNYQCCYSLGFDANELYINKYDGGNFTSGSKLTTLQGFYHCVAAA